MFAIALHYLCGFAAATHPNIREAPEWPPHPDRIFMALVASYFDAEQTEDERRALEWIEELPPQPFHAVRFFLYANQLQSSCL